MEIPRVNHCTTNRRNYPYEPSVFRDTQHSSSRRFHAPRSRVFPFMDQIRCGDMARLQACFAQGTVLQCPRQLQAAVRAGYLSLSTISLSSPPSRSRPPPPPSVKKTITSLALIHTVPVHSQFVAIFAFLSHDSASACTISQRPVSQQFTPAGCLP